MKRGVLEDRSMTSVELLPHNARLCDAAGGMQGRWGQQAAIISTADTVLVITDRRPGLVDTASPATLFNIHTLQSTFRQRVSARKARAL